MSNLRLCGEEEAVFLRASKCGISGRTLRQEFPSIHASMRRVQHFCIPSREIATPMSNVAYFFFFSFCFRTDLSHSAKSESTRRRMFVDSDKISFFVEKKISLLFRISLHFYAQEDILHSHSLNYFSAEKFISDFENVNP